MDFFDGCQPAFTFFISGISTQISVVSFQAHEWISHYYSVKLNVSTSALDLYADVLGKEGVLTIINNDGENCGMHRYFHGMIGELEHVGICDERYVYEVELVPTLWRLTLRRNCRIFQEMKVQDIVRQILEEHAVGSDRYRFALVDEDRKRGFCVQYRETDYEFISRLLEEEGIFYFFQHSKDSHLLIFSDDNAMYAPISGNPFIYFNNTGMNADNDCIKAFTVSQRLQSQVFTHRNYNFKKPTLDLTSGTAGKSNQQQLEVYDYPGLHISQAHGRKVARVRMEELAAQQSQGHGQTSCCRLIPGYTFTLTGHQSGPLNGEYLITSIVHSGFQPQSLEEMSAGGFSYDTEFTVIPAYLPFRPAITGQKTTIPGLQTAIVVGPPGEEIYTDQYGRIKVRFHWDREAQNDAKSSCWLRINQPWSGSRWGMIAIPRVGDEVLVAFLDGDPDRPIMVGNVNNGDSPALYQLPANQTQVGIRTQSTPNGSRDNFHELRFEDQKGSEEIYLQSERDWNILVKNDKGEIIGNNEKLLVKNDRTKSVGMNQSESIGINNRLMVGADHEERIGANMNSSVGANRSETVGANSAESVGLAKELTVGGLYQVSVGGVMNETVAGAKTEEVGLTKCVVIGANMSEKVLGDRQISVGTNLEIRAGDSFLISCGNSTFRMHSDGSVFINGTKFDFTASGVVKVTGEDIQLN